MNSFQKNTYYEIFSGNEKSNRVVLFLHGYPSDLGDKNADLAEFVFKEINFDCFVIHYPGLGKSKGKFSFKKSLEAVDEFCIYLKSLGYKDIDLVGHSWGGFLALSSIKHWNESSKIILMSPFLFLPKDNELKNLITMIYNETKENLLPKSLDEVLSELTEMEKVNSRSKLISDLKLKTNQITFIQALDDEECPTEVAKEFLAEVNLPTIKYIEMDTDHSFFRGREELKRMIVSNLKNKQR